MVASVLETRKSHGKLKSRQRKEKTGNLRKRSNSVNFVWLVPKYSSFHSPQTQLDILVSAKMLRQDFMETSLRSGRSQGKFRENKALEKSQNSTICKNNEKLVEF